MSIPGLKIENINIIVIETETMFLLIYMYRIIVRVVAVFEQPFLMILRFHLRSAPHSLIVNISFLKLLCI